MTEPLGARAVTHAAVSHVIVRACTECGAPRQKDAPCTGCGLADPPAVHDLGVQARYHRSPLRRAAWWLAGQHLAARRARAAARYTRGGN